ncbi:hypothetical protein K402DRAFT_453430 [Aulographum hederae CBS 113979]|uniref:Uncharacterized protein n=1 Tax=Aulographum hederae CBS 113979 TaxID=1176131 RepID=A0A6G1H3H7_9PEZI|nr:hypothetical protein K402DRAFT_453430 [Aulographum hederae CBS 113979]
MGTYNHYFQEPETRIPETVPEFDHEPEPPVVQTRSLTPSSEPAINSPAISAASDSETLIGSVQVQTPRTPKDNDQSFPTFPLTQKPNFIQSTLEVAVRLAKEYATHEHYLWLREEVPKQVSTDISKICPHNLESRVCPRVDTCPFLQICLKDGCPRSSECGFPHILTSCQSFVSDTDLICLESDCKKSHDPIRRVRANKKDSHAVESEKEKAFRLLYLSSRTEGPPGKDVTNASVELERPKPVTPSPPIKALESKSANTLLQPVMKVSLNSVVESKSREQAWKEGVKVLGPDSNRTPKDVLHRSPGSPTQPAAKPPTKPSANFQQQKDSKVSPPKNPRDAPKPGPINEGKQLVVNKNKKPAAARRRQKERAEARIMLEAKVDLGVSKMTGQNHPATSVRTQIPVRSSIQDEWKRSATPDISPSLPRTLPTNTEHSESPVQNVETPEPAEDYIRNLSPDDPLQEVRLYLQKRIDGEKEYADFVYKILGGVSVSLKPAEGKLKRKHLLPIIYEMLCERLKVVFSDFETRPVALIITPTWKNAVAISRLPFVLDQRGLPGIESSRPLFSDVAEVNIQSLVMRLPGRGDIIITTHGGLAHICDRKKNANSDSSIDWTTLRYVLFDLMTPTKEPLPDFYNAPLRQAATGLSFPSKLQISVFSKGVSPMMRKWIQQEVKGSFIKPPRRPNAKDSYTPGMPQQFFAAYWAWKDHPATSIKDAAGHFRCLCKHGANPVVRWGLDFSVLQ